MNHHHNNLLRILLDYAPNSAAQDLIARQFAQIGSQAYRTTDDPDREITRALTNTLADGLNHGNWPWNRPTVDNLTPVFKIPEIPTTIGKIDRVTGRPATIYTPPEDTIDPPVPEPTEPATPWLHCEACANSGVGACDNAPHHPPVD